MLKSAIKRTLNSLGWELRKAVPPPPSRGYIRAQETVAAATAQGLSVCGYVEQLWGETGRTQSIFNRLANIAGVSFRPTTAVEIGPGTGRYLALTLERYAGLRYEIYETAADWADWLAATYPIVRHAADGHSLKQTLSNSINLIQAHGVFVYLPFLTTYEYLSEIARVARDHEALVACDFLTESSMTDAIVAKWLADTPRYQALFPRDYLLDFFKKRHFTLTDSFHAPYDVGLSEYFVFRR